MSNVFLGQITMMGCNFAPRGFAGCSGQLLSIAQNTALFALLGTTYGGNGQTTFALPDMRGRFPNHQGQGPGLSAYVMGEQVGIETVTLTSGQIPQHSHLPNSNSGNGTSADPTNNIWSTSGARGATNYSNVAPNTPMNAAAIGLAGGNQPHQNVQPYLVINFVIALEGIFPSRN